MGGGCGLCVSLDGHGFLVTHFLLAFGQPSQIFGIWASIYSYTFMSVVVVLMLILVCPSAYWVFVCLEKELFCNNCDIPVSDLQYFTDVELPSVLVELLSNLILCGIVS